MKTIVALATALAFTLTACSPSTLEECRAEAARLPTDMGVRIAVMDCQRKFGFDPSTARAAQ